MTTRSKLVAVAMGAFLAGTLLPALVVWNPAGWVWADRFMGRMHEPHEVTDAAGKTLYTCGMHTQVIQDEPGDCPICGMRLMPVKDAGAGGGAAQGERKILYWRAPMDPNFISDQPGKSPMGMDLVPVYEDQGGGGGSAGSVRVDPSFLQNFAVRTTVVERGTIPIDIRTIGILEHNEANVVSVNTKFEGWIEKSYYNTIGEHVKRGDLLFEIYSPQLVTTQKEYLAAVSYVDRLSGAAYPEAVERAESLLESARERLRYWDVSEEQIDQLKQSGKVQRTVKIFSPASGHIAGKAGDALEGMRLTPGMTVLKLADHSKLWAAVEFYEDQLQHVRKGTYVRIEVAAFPGRRWAGRIVLFDSMVDPKTRTLKAYVEVNNSDLKLIPGMYATVRVIAPAVANAVKVPAQAVLHSGERSVVIVQTAKGVFEPREVKLGPTGGDDQEVREGLEPGEIIVTSSQFLIASESNLKAAIQQLLGERSKSDSPPPEQKPPSAVLEQ